MRVTLHGVGVGVTEDGTWVEKRGDGWHAIPPPSWVTDADSPAVPMTDPYERKQTDVSMVKVLRVTRRTVPDYEAEVLVRNGWEYDVPDPQP
jgi:hypothetical protein